MNASAVVSAAVRDGLVIRYLPGGRPLMVTRNGGNQTLSVASFRKRLRLVFELLKSVRLAVKGIWRVAQHHRRLAPPKKYPTSTWRRQRPDDRSRASA